MAKRGSQKVTLMVVGEPSDPRPLGSFVSCDPSGSVFARHIHSYDVLDGTSEDASFRTIGPSRVPWNDMAHPIPGARRSDEEEI